MTEPRKTEPPKEYIPKCHGARANLPKVDYTHLPPEIMAVVNESKGFSQESCCHPVSHGDFQQPALPKQCEGCEADTCAEACQDWIEQHDAAVRKDEREKVLDDITQW